MATRISYFTTAAGRAPFAEWVKGLDFNTQAVVDRFVDRVSQGGAKKSIKSLKDGVYEIKIPYAGGLRLYFALINTKHIVLLAGGKKATQPQDIKKAKQYWRTYAKQI